MCFWPLYGFIVITQNHIYNNKIIIKIWVSRVWMRIEMLEVFCFYSQNNSDIQNNLVRFRQHNYLARFWQNINKHLVRFRQQPPKKNKENQEILPSLITFSFRVTVSVSGTIEKLTVTHGRLLCGAVGRERDAATRRAADSHPSVCCHCPLFVSLPAMKLFFSCEEMAMWHGRMRNMVIGWVSQSTRESRQPCLKLEYR